MGQSDIHRLSEAIVCPVLKIVLKLPALRNLNSVERDNFPGIDLGDPVAGVGIQVTARADAPKIRSTIKKCISHGLHQTYPHLRFFVLTKKQSTYRLNVKPDLSGKLRFDPRVDILDYTDVLKVLAKLPTADLSAVEEVLEADLGIRSAPSIRSSWTSTEEHGWLNLLPITFPSRLYLGEVIPEARPRSRSRHRNPRHLARKYLSDNRLTFSSDWSIYDGQVITFHDLRQRDLPLSRLVDPGTVTDFATEEYHSVDNNYRHAFKHLLRLCMQQMLYRRGVFWQHKVGLFCFGPPDDGRMKRYESWGDKKTATRLVFKRVPKRDAPEEIYHCKHFAFRATFHVLSSTWYVSIRPEWFFSYNGYHRWFHGAERVDYLKRREKNQTVFNHVKFLAHFLGGGTHPDLFRTLPTYPFLTFGPLASVAGLPQLDDNLWRSAEVGPIHATLVDPKGVIPLELEGW